MSLLQLEVECLAVSDLAEVEVNDVHAGCKVLDVHMGGKVPFSI